MTKRILLLTVLYTTIVTSGNAQRSAQAVMQVSVTVVKSSQVAVVAPIQFILSEENNSEVGKFTIVGMDKAITSVQFPESVKLQNEHGESILIPLKTEKEESEKMSAYSVIVTSNKKHARVGHFSGSYKASVAYN